MKFLFPLLLFAFSFVTVSAQVSFENLPKEEQSEIMRQLSDISKVPRSAAFIGITPIGKVWDKQTYNPPKITGDSVKYDGTPATEILYRSLQGIPNSLKVFLYNGNTLVAHGLVEVRAYLKGKPVKYTVARLETYVKSNGRWELAAGSGTYIEPPTPDTN